MDGDIRLEMRRKVMHSLGLPIPIGYYFVTKGTLLKVLIPIFIFYAGCDLLRLWHKGFRRIFDRVISSRFLRPREERNLIGSTYFLIGTIFAVIFYEREAVIPALFILLISDTLASFVGSLYGRRRIFGLKTWEGSVAFLLSALVIVALTFRGSPLWGVLAAIAATLVEAMPLRVDDNLSIPIITGGILQIGLG